MIFSPKKHSRKSRSIISRLSFLSLAIILFAAAPLGAHVGSPDVFYEGLAGPYHLFVTVRVPQVIPGVAEIEVRSESKDVSSIQVVPLRLTGQGSNVAPAPDIAQQSKDDPQFFTGALWLMETGALQVRVMADGARGKGELSVPVPSYAQKVLPMEKPLEGVMIVLLLVLTIGIVSIVGAGAREAKLDPGAQLPQSNSRRARIIMIVTAIVVIAAVYLGRSWWDAGSRRITSATVELLHAAARGNKIRKRKSIDYHCVWQRSQLESQHQLEGRDSGSRPLDAFVSDWQRRNELHVASSSGPNCGRRVLRKMCRSMFRPVIIKSLRTLWTVA